MHAILIPATAIVAPMQAAQPTSDRVAAEALMANAAASWSAGDMARFLSIYADDATFINGTEVLRGRAAMAAHYEKAFDFADPAKRGNLSFEIKDFRMLPGDHAAMIVQYTLAYPTDDAVSGLASLVLRKSDRGWRIIADHSS